MSVGKKPKIFISHSLGDKTDIPGEHQFYGTHVGLFLNDIADLTIYSPSGTQFTEFTSITESIKSSDYCICAVGVSYLQKSKASSGLTHIALREMCYAFKVLGPSKIFVIDVDNVLKNSMDQLASSGPCLHCDPAVCSRETMLSVIRSYYDRGKFFTPLSLGAFCLFQPIKDRIKEFISQPANTATQARVINPFLPVPAGAEFFSSLGREIPKSLENGHGKGQLIIICGEKCSGKTSYIRHQLVDILYAEEQKPILLTSSADIAETLCAQAQVQKEDVEEKLRNRSLIPYLDKKRIKAVFIVDEDRAQLDSQRLKYTIEILLLCQAKVIVAIRPQTFSLCYSVALPYTQSITTYYLNRPTDEQAAKSVEQLSRKLVSDDSCCISREFGGAITEFNLSSIMFAAFCPREYTKAHDEGTFTKSHLSGNLVGKVFEDLIARGAHEQFIHSLFVRLSVVYADPHTGRGIRLFSRSALLFSADELDVLRHFVETGYVAYDDSLEEPNVFIPSDAVVELTRIKQWLEADLGEKAFYLTLVEFSKRTTEGVPHDWPQLKAKEWCIRRGLLRADGEPHPDPAERSRALADAVEWAVRYAGEAGATEATDAFSAVKAKESLTKIVELTRVKEVLESAASQLNGSDVHGSLAKLTKMLWQNWHYASSGLLRQASASLQGVEAIITVATGTKEEAHVNVVQWLDRQRLVYGTYGGTVGEIDLATLVPRNVTRLEQAVYYIAVPPTILSRPTGPFRYVSADWAGTATAFGDGESRTLLKGGGRLFCAAYSEDGRHLVVAGGKGGAWIMEEECIPLSGHADDTVVFGACFAGDDTVITVSYAGDILIHDLRGTKLYKLPEPSGSSFNHVATPPKTAFFNRDAVVVSCIDGNAYLYRFCHGGLQPAGKLSGHSHWVRYAEFSPDGSLVVTASSDTRAYLWDVTSLEQPQLRAVLAGHTNWIRQAIFSPLGDMIATAGRDGRIGLWDTAGRSLAMLGGHGGREWTRHIAFSSGADGAGIRLASCGTNGTVRIWRPYDFRPEWSANGPPRTTPTPAVAMPEYPCPLTPVTKIVVIDERTIVVLLRARDSGGWLYRRKDGPRWEAELLGERIADMVAGPSGIHIVPAPGSLCTGALGQVAGLSLPITLIPDAVCLSQSPNRAVFAISKHAARPIHASAPALELEDGNGYWEIRYAAFAARSFAVHMIERIDGIIASEAIASLTHAEHCDQRVTLAPRRGGTKVAIAARCECHDGELEATVGMQNQDLHSHMRLNGIPVNATTGLEIDTIKRIDISRCGRYFVSAGLDNQARIYTTGSMLSKALLAQDAGLVAHMELVDLGDGEEDGKVAEVGVLTTGGDGSVRMWSVSLENDVHPLLLGVRCGHLAPVSYVAIIEGGDVRQFVSGGADGSICFWSTSVFDHRRGIIKEIERLYPETAHQAE